MRGYCAVAVLADRPLLSLIASFQRGIPQLILDLVKEQHAREPNVYRGSLFWGSALRLGSLKAVQILHRLRQAPDLQDHPAMEIDSLSRFAATSGRVDVLQWLHDNDIEPAPWPARLFFEAAHAKKDDAVRWLIVNRPDACEKDVPDGLAEVAARGNLELLKELISIRPEALTTVVMDVALRHAQWEVIHYLHEHSSAGCSTDGMDGAATRGHGDVVRFLHENRSEGCTTKTMDNAAFHGDLQLVKFLHTNRTEGCTTNAMNFAAYRGHLEVVRFLHENRSEGCTEKAMTVAASNGHLAVVQFLHENRDEGCVEKALKESAKRGHTEIVQYLSRIEGSSRAKEAAATES